MPFKSALDLYSDVVLPRLAESPQTLEQLGVPPYALKHLQAHGLVAAKMYRIESCAVQVWFLREDLELLREAGLEEPRRRQCWELTDEDYEELPPH